MTEYINIDDSVIVASNDVLLLKKEYEAGNAVLLLLDESNAGEDTSFIRFATILDNANAAEDGGTAGNVEPAAGADTKENKISTVIERGLLEMVLARHQNRPLTICDTNRLHIRELSQGDESVLARIYDEAEGFLEPFYDNECELDAILGDYCRNTYDFYGFGIYAVCLKNTQCEKNTIIGIAGFTQKSEDYVEMGYGLLKDFRGRGYAYEACSALLYYMQENFDDFNCLIRVSRDNIAGMALAKKLAGDFAVRLEHR